MLSSLSFLVNNEVANFLSKLIGMPYFWEKNLGLCFSKSVFVEAILNPDRVVKNWLSVALIFAGWVRCSIWVWATISWRLCPVSCALSPPSKVNNFSWVNEAKGQCTLLLYLPGKALFLPPNLQWIKQYNALCTWAILTGTPFWLWGDPSFCEKWLPADNFVTSDRVQSCSHAALLPCPSPREFVALHFSHTRNVIFWPHCCRPNPHWRQATAKDLRSNLRTRVQCGLGQSQRNGTCECHCFGDCHPCRRHCDRHHCYEPPSLPAVNQNASHEAITWRYAASTLTSVLLQVECWGKVVQLSIPPNRQQIKVLWHLNSTMRFTLVPSWQELHSPGGGCGLENSTIVRAKTSTVEHSTCLSPLSIKNTHEVNSWHSAASTLISALVSELHAANNRLRSLPLEFGFLVGLKRLHLQKNNLKELPEVRCAYHSEGGDRTQVGQEHLKQIRPMQLVLLSSFPNWQHGARKCRNEFEILYDSPQ